MSSENPTKTELTFQEEIELRKYCIEMAAKDNSISNLTEKASDLYQFIVSGVSRVKHRPGL